MRCSFFFFLCFLISSAAADTVVFNRPLRQGEIYKLTARTSQTSRYSFRLQGNPEPVVRMESISASFQGYLTILKVNQYGNPEKISIRADSLNGTVNGKKVSFSAGRILTADLSGPRPLFNSDSGTLSVQETALLRSLFHPAGDNRLSDLTGEKRNLQKTGEGWQLNLKKFLQTLSLRKIRIAPSKIRSGIRYQGKEKVGTMECRKFNLLLETAGTGEYDFRLNASVSLAPAGPPVHIKRDAVEIVHRTLSGNHPFASGANVELYSSDQTEQWMFPVKNIPAIRETSAADGAWNALLQ